MCQSVEDYAEKKIHERLVETKKNFIKKGTISNEEIADNFGISLEEVQRIAAQTV